jgi:hypothetical protein
MNCPRCETSALQEREREGLTIDICPSCRGIWLDRGELEKLIARATRDFDGDALEVPRSPAPYPVRSRADSDHDGYDDDDDDRRRRHHEVPYGAPKRKKRWYESLGDIFD